MDKAENLLETTDGFLTGGGEMGALIRSLDWSETPIGPTSGWSQALRTTGGLLLHSGFPLILWWGPKFIQFYNDPYRPIPGEKHPRSMGQPASECWSEIWPIIGPMIEVPFSGGPATTSDDLFLMMNRKGFLEETHFKVAYSPVPDQTVRPTRIGGVLATVAETTEQVYGERQLRTLRELGARAAWAKTPDQACLTAASTLKENALDVPFALFYLLEGGGKHARLAGSCGFAIGGEANPKRIAIVAGDKCKNGWPLGRAVEKKEIDVLQDLSQRFKDLPVSPWSESPRSAVILPLSSPDQERPYGVLVAGVSPHRELSEGYRTFFELAAGQITTAIRNATAYQEERKRAEALAEIARAKTTFFSNVSHEFRTPLTLMLGPLEDLLSKPGEDLPSEAKDQLSLIHRNGLRLLKLVNTLLDFSRIEAGRIQASYEPTDISAFTAELASVFRSAIEKAGMRLNVDCPPLPQPIYVDREMWEKVVLNLLSNAFKFTFEGEIKVSLEWCADLVELRVSDTGTGIAPEEMPHLFERFHRIKGAKSRSYEGTGIGLALVHELVRLHAGSIRAESEAGRGTTFTVSIPTGQSHLPAEKIGVTRTLASTSMGAAPYVEEALRSLPEDIFHDLDGPNSKDYPAYSPADGSRARVLLADDNADMRGYIHRLLATHYEVESVADGTAALNAAMSTPPDLVLTDIMMPGLDGFELLKALRVDPRTRTIPVIFLSARAGEEAKVEGMEAGADDYLVKPFSARELMARVAAHFQMARVRSEALLREQGLRNQLERELEERRRAEDTLRESEKRYRNLFNSLIEGFCIIEMVFDADGRPVDYRFLEINPAFEAQTGLHDARGKFMRELAPEHEAHWFEIYGKIALTGEPAQFENEAKALNRWYAVRAFRVGGQESRQVAICFNDITQRKRMEDELRRSRGDLEIRVQERTVELAEANRELQEEIHRREKAEQQLLQAQKMESIGTLAGGIAHDFNNILGTIVINSEMSLLDLDRDSELRNNVELIHKSGLRGRDLVKQLLLFSRKTGKKQEIVTLTPLVKDTFKLLRASIPTTIEMKLHLETEFDGVYADPSQIQQVVMNLCTNAAYAMRGMAGSIDIFLQGSSFGADDPPEADMEPGDYLVLSVKDTGCGMDDEIKKRIFEPFFTTKPVGEGTGLGLSVAYGIVKNHRGNITVYSEPGNGSIFKVYLPKVDTGAGVKTGPLEPIPRGNERILFVDDEEFNITSVRNMLQHLGYKVTALLDSREALKLFSADPSQFDLVMTDQTMPFITGESLGKEMMRVRPDIPVILCTGYSDLITFEKAKEMGFRGFIMKPFTVREAAEIVRRVLDQKTLDFQ